MLDKCEKVFKRQMAREDRLKRSRRFWRKSFTLFVHGFSFLAFFLNIDSTEAQMMAASPHFMDASSDLLTAHSVILSLNSTTDTKKPDIVHDHLCDSDSCQIAVDNCSTRCITNDIRDFIGKPRQTSVNTKGVSGSSRATLVGTAKWIIQDDDGVCHEWLTPNTHCHPDSPHRLLSPQHWAQERGEKRGAACATHFDAVELFWSQGNCFRTTELDPSLNVALIRSAPSFRLCSSFCTDFSKVRSPLNKAEFFCSPCLPEIPTAVTDDEQSSDEGEDDESVASRLHPDLPDTAFDKATGADKELPPDFDMTTLLDFEVGKQNPNVIPEDVEVQGATPEAQMLAWHCRFGHISFERIRGMAERGDLPRALLEVTANPKCSACLFGKITKRPWRTKAPVNKMKVPPANRPGAAVAVDQLVSSTPGLIGQMKGFLTRKRHMVTTVFVDHCSDFTCVHNQMSTDAEHTIEAKQSFERAAMAHGVKVRHCHADNGIFSSKAFINEVNRCGQSTSFCAVNAHHQNGKAEEKIRDLQEQARTMILHAARRWPDAITANLWPFAIWHANDIANAAPSIGRKHVSPIEAFAQVDVAPKLKHAHTFGSPACVLDSRLQVGKRISKWEHRSRIGVCLGVSPRHSRKVALVLSLKTGHASPQFHCHFDDLCKCKSTKLCPPVSNRDIDQSVLLLNGEHPQLEHSIPKDDVWSLATGQLRTNWGQPTARVCLCCSKVPTRVFS